MKLYMFAEHDDLVDLAMDLHQDIKSWAQPKTIIHSIHRGIEKDIAPNSHRDLEVGIEMETKKAQKLKEPMEFLQTLANRYRCDFSIGVIESDGYRDVCFFGYEEGKPHYTEIANYLGM